MGFNLLRREICHIVAEFLSILSYEVQDRGEYARPRHIIFSRREEIGRRRRLLLAAVGVLHSGLGLLEGREWNPDLEGALRIQIEKMVLAANRSVRNALLVEELTELGVDARVVTLPECA